MSGSVVVYRLGSDRFIRAAAGESCFLELIRDIDTALIEALKQGEDYSTVLDRLLRFMPPTIVATAIMCVYTSDRRQYLESLVGPSDVITPELAYWHACTGTELP